MPEYRPSCQSWHKKISIIRHKEHSADKHVPDNSACTPLQDRLADASSEFDVWSATSVTLRSANICRQNGSRLCFSPDLWEEGINAGLLTIVLMVILLITVVTIMQENPTMHI